MADRKPSDVAALLGEMTQLVGTLQQGFDLAVTVVNAATLLADHYGYWLRQRALDNAPISNPGETWDRLVAAKDLVAGIAGGVRPTTNLLNALLTATKASAALVGDLPGGRQTDPPPPE